MEQKNPNKVKQILIFIAWGLLAMIVAFLLVLASAVFGFGV